MKEWILPPEIPTLIDYRIASRSIYRYVVEKAVRGLEYHIPRVTCAKRRENLEHQLASLGRRLMTMPEEEV